MDKIIGLGKTGCGIAEEFCAYPEYRIYKIGVGIPARGNLVLEEQEDIAAYEEAADAIEMAGYLRSVKPGDEVLFIVAGDEPISGLSLTILEQIKDVSITVLYIAPDSEVCSDEQKINHRIVYNILQEYTRSGVFRRMFLAHRRVVEELVGDVSVREYEKSINNFIAYVVAMVNYCDHTEPVVSNKTSPAEISRIGTVGVSSLEPKDDIQFLFDLSTATDVHHYYAIPSQDLDEQKGLMRDIKMRTKRFAKEGINTSFSVYSTTFDQPIVLVTAFTKDLQTN
tara:strand:+ start:1315 stop:2160 length:846 start_codon:yes stop_codon:yes gene_type:complete